MLNAAGEVRAAGGVVCRATARGLEVLLVHRERYDDWTIPKGKVEEGETDEACATREVEEEAGVRPRLRDELPSVRWRDAEDRPKVARYWRMELEDADAVAEPRDEVDEVAWLPLAEAVDRLSHPRDAEVLRALAAGDQTRSR